jgi:uncharacterized protein involved in exopolysaccharide biosynthesis
VAQKDLLSRLADAGEDAMAKLAEMPGGHRALEAMNVLKNRMDELQKRLRALDPLERKVAELERRLEALEGKGRSSRSSSSARKAP